MSPSEARLRIAYCLPTVMPFHQISSGDHTQQAETIRALQSRGHQVTFVAPVNTREVLCSDSWEVPRLARHTWTDSAVFDIAARSSWRLQRMLGIPYLNYFSNWRLYDAAKSCLAGVNVVHERCGLYREGIARASRALDIPYVLFFDADELMEADYEGRPIKGMLRWRATRTVRLCLKTADRVIAVCDPAKRHLIQEWSVDSTKIEVLPNAVDTNRHRPYPEMRADVRSRLKLGNEPLLIFVSSFHRWHDVETALEAFSQLLTEYADAQLLLIGDGECRPAMQSLASELGISDSTVFMGKVPHQDIPQYISASDVALALYPPMKQEFWGSPMKIFEYMACGTATIASAVGQLSSVIEHERSGMLVAPGDVSAVTATMRLLLANPELRTRLGHYARIQALRHHSWGSYIERLEAIYTRTQEAHIRKSRDLAQL